jgi:CheY-like chemotaxis protein
VSPILLVEDDPADARLLKRAFEKAQVTAPVVRLTNGDEAVAYLSGEEPFADRMRHPLPTLIVLDIKLPRRSGLEVLQWIRANESGVHRVPVVILSSSRQPSDINRAYDLGVNSYLSKPETSDELFNMAMLFRRYWLELNQSPTTPADATQAAAPQEKA